MILPIINNTNNKINFSADKGKEETKKAIDYDILKTTRKW